MIKICSLEFLNKNSFDVDITLADGRVLFSAGDPITPSLLLRLYYKEIFINGYPIKKERELDEDLDSNEACELTVDKVESFFEESPEPEEEIEKTREYATVAIADEDDSNEPLEFDEEQGKRVAQLTVKFAQHLGISQQQIQELHQAAYYHKIGRTKLKKSDLGERDFYQKQGDAGYEILTKEMKLSERIAEAAKFYYRRCQGSQMQYDNQNYSDIPYSHIVAITSYYDDLISVNLTEDAALQEMLRQGGNKFNIFILHKFISMMRNTND